LRASLHLGSFSHSLAFAHSHTRQSSRCALPPPSLCCHLLVLRPQRPCREQRAQSALPVRTTTTS